MLFPLYLDQTFTVYRELDRVSPRVFQTGSTWNGLSFNPQQSGSTFAGIKLLRSSDPIRELLSLLAAALRNDGGIVPETVFSQTSSWPFAVCLRSYYESNDLPAALGVIEEALSRHPGLVGDDFVNMAAELYISSRQHSKALQVRESASVGERERELIEGRFPGSGQVYWRGSGEGQRHVWRTVSGGGGRREEGDERGRSGVESRWRRDCWELQWDSFQSPWAAQRTIEEAENSCSKRRSWTNVLFLYFRTDQTSSCLQVTSKPFGLQTASRWTSEPSCWSASSTCKSSPLWRWAELQWCSRRFKTENTFILFVVLAAGVGADGAESGGDRRPVPGRGGGVPGAGSLRVCAAAAVCPHRFWKIQLGCCLAATCR